MKLFRAFLLFFVTFFALQWSSLAINAKKEVIHSYIVYLGGVGDEFEASKIQANHFDILGSILGSKDKVDDAMIYSYDKHINGFAAVLDEEHVAKLAEHPDVVSVIESKGLKLHTTHSWDFLKLERDNVIDASSLWAKAKYGENIIIANLDTGVWPESKSFSDVGYGPIPSKWKGGCQNQTLAPCNNKLIGAKYFNQGYQATNGNFNCSLNNARDHDGHGSHTLSTAGGNFVRGVSLNDMKLGTAKGGSPKARVAAYKVCWPPTKDGGCYDVDTVKGFDEAMHDGVDVLSVSLGGTPVDYIEDGMAIASFHAMKNGITVVFSAGNDGPTPGSVTNVAPWVITVGASTIDREFQSSVNLASGVSLKGLSLSKPLPNTGFYPLINSADAKAENAPVMNATLCMEGALDPKKVKGKILVCLRGVNTRVDKGKQAALAGAAGMILCNDKASGDDLLADPHILPATHITYEDGRLVYNYLNSTNNPVGYITPPKPVVNVKRAPSMAGFSSRGPNTVTPGILKPDITAPGVNIIAAYTEDSDGSAPVHKYNVESGTSMACPHVSGVVGLLKSLHPDWSPAAIKSAIMTTANARDNTGRPMLDESKIEASPFSRGAGDIDPNRAMNPGLVYDLGVNDYLDFLCAIGYNQTVIQKFSNKPHECPENYSLLDFNYPSITVDKLNGTAIVTRKLTNVGRPGVYTAHVKNPAGVSVDVEPKSLVFKTKGDVQKFVMTVKADGKSDIEDYVFGELVWTNGKQHVKSPIVVSV
ncbi:subtilisin-like protease SBT5.4 [Rutidosis leptorrhynchoides]|uniref:subtilisin-like protease SBT5.4 n=1 Tax=Rutidosis leptorrhynchoides TaxID=125765 RepID=UPI003A9956B7